MSKVEVVNTTTGKVLLSSDIEDTDSCLACLLERVTTGRPKCYLCAEVV